MKFLSKNAILPFFKKRINMEAVTKYTNVNLLFRLRRQRMSDKSSQDNAVSLSVPVSAPQLISQLKKTAVRVGKQFSVLKRY